MSTDTPVIHAERLTRYFGQRPVLRDLTLQLPRGKISALLGLNGAGKTTALRIFMGILRPTRGQVTVMGCDPSSMPLATRAKIGYMVEGHFLYPSMRVDQTIDYQRAGHVRWDDALLRSVLSHFAIEPKSRIGNLSRGQRAGVSLALTLAPHPELLVLDDPALGLDPVSRRALNETLLEFAGEGQRTVLLSTHLLDDVERVADHVFMLVDGRLQVDASLEAFCQRVQGFVGYVEREDVSALARIPRLVEARRLGNRMKFVVADADDQTARAIGQITGAPVEPLDLSFADSVLAYLTRTRTDQAFTSTEKMGALG